MSSYPPPPVSSIQPVALPPKYVSETKPLTANFLNELSSGDSISSVTSVTVTVLQGTDPNPNNIKSGTSSISGTNVIQMITGGVANTQYQVEFIVSTAQSNVLAGIVTFWIVTG